MNVNYGTKYITKPDCRQKLRFYLQSTSSVRIRKISLLTLHLQQRSELVQFSALVSVLQQNKEQSLFTLTNPNADVNVHDSQFHCQHSFCI